MKKNIRTFIILFSIVICAHAQYEKPAGNIRFMTYNVAYCKSTNGAVTGATATENIKNIGAVIKALDPDVISIQELDSGATARGRRFLLEDIKQATGTDYQVVYGNACSYNGGSIGCGILIKKDFPILKIKKTPLPGDEARALVRVETDKFYFMATHLDLNDPKRISSAAIINNELDYMRKPTFLAGDLNDSHRWGNGAFAQFFNDKWEIYSTTDYTISDSNNKNTIDYVLYYNYKNQDMFSVTQSKAVRDYLTANGRTIHTEIASDHLPVYTDLKYNGTNNVELDFSNKLNIYNDGYNLYINGENGEEYNCSVNDIKGNMICSHSFVGEQTIDISGWNSGVYILKLINKSQSYTQKIIIP